jgi:integrase
MVGKRAKILSADHVEDLLVFAHQTRHPIRNRVLVLLSVKAGLRAGEIANLTWPMERLYSLSRMGKHPMMPKLLERRGYT